MIRKCDLFIKVRNIRKIFLALALDFFFNPFTFLLLIFFALFHIWNIYSFRCLICYYNLKTSKYVFNVLRDYLHFHTHFSWHIIFFNPRFLSHTKYSSFLMVNKLLKPRDKLLIPLDERTWPLCVCVYAFSSRR